MSSIASPCSDVCRMDPASGWCEGCLRTIDEIVAWGKMPDGAKQVVWADLPRRRRLWEQARQAQPDADPQAGGS